MKARLAPVYMDSQPVELQEPQPSVSTILFASGKPSATKVQRILSWSDTQGIPMRPDDVVDRTSDPSAPIYLTSAPRR